MAHVHAASLVNGPANGQPANASRSAPASSLLDTLRAILRDWHRAASRKYRPEQHYMRGPGPACRARLRG